MALFMVAFGKPIYAFIEGIQVDIVPKGDKKDERRPFGHRLYARVLELESKLDMMAKNVQIIPGLSAMLEALPDDAKNVAVQKLTEVAKKVLMVVQKYKMNQLPF